MTPAIRTVLPLAVVTGTSMLAMDLFLPAVPALQAALGIGVERAQASVSLFLAGLAASQLLWGEAMSRFGPRACVAAGVFLLAAGALGCALAPDIDVLLAMRLLQGVAAGAATVVAPSVVRATLSDEQAVRGIASISMIEAIVPAAGPVLGTLLLTLTDWRGLFWVLAASTALALPFAVRVTPRELPGHDRQAPSGYAQLMRNGRFVRLAMSHALAVGALLTFVASAPQLLKNALQRDAASFALLQVIGVASFMAIASQSGRASARLGTVRAVRLGGGVQLMLCLALLAVSLLAPVPFVLLLAFWGLFCAALAIRGPAAFSEALRLPPAQMGRASAAMVLALLATGAAGTQLVAPAMGGSSAAPLLACMAAMTGASLLLVLRLPRDASAA